MELIDKANELNYRDESGILRRFSNESPGSRLTHRKVISVPYEFS